MPLNEKGNFNYNVPKNMLWEKKSFKVSFMAKNDAITASEKMQQKHSFIRSAYKGLLL